MRSRDWDHPGQNGETPSLLKIQKISGAWVAHPLSYSGGWGRRIAWTQEAEVAVSRDRTIAFQPGWQSKTLSKKKEHYLQRITRQNSTFQKFQVDQLHTMLVSIFKTRLKSIFKNQKISHNNLNFWFRLKTLGDMTKWTHIPTWIQEAGVPFRWDSLPQHFSLPPFLLHPVHFIHLTHLSSPCSHVSLWLLPYVLRTKESFSRKKAVCLVCFQNIRQPDGRQEKQRV